MLLISSSARKSFLVRLCLLSLPLLLTALLYGQTPVASAVPQMVKYSGTLNDDTGRARAGVIGVTFAVYRDEHGGSPLWMETQNVQADRSGAYTVDLGSSKSAGLPRDLFASGEARWLGVQPEGQAEQTRVLLLSVPYALKAGDAETIGGLPPSAFVLAAPVNGNSSANGAASSENAPPPASNVTTAGGTVNTIPLFSTGTDIENSAITQTGSGTSAKVGIATTTPATTLDVKGGTTLRGTLSLGATGAATAAAGKSSQPENLAASSFNSSTSSAVSQTFQLKAEPTGNNTASPSGTLNLLFGSGTASPAETGFKVASNGQITFASGQTFPGTGTITGVTAGSGLSGGGTTGNVTLKLLSTCATNQILQWNGSAWVCASVGTGTITSVTAGTDLTGGGSSGGVTLNLDTTKVPQLNAANTFVGNQTVTGNLTTTGTETAGFFNTNGTYNIGNAVFARGNASLANAAVGYAGLLSATGDANTAVGDGALLVDTSGSGNTGVGYDAIVSNDSGAGNTAVGQESLEINVKGSFNTAIGWLAGVTIKDGSFNTGLGYFAGPDFSAEGISNSTAVGAYADVSESNALVLGSINGVNDATADTNVGIGTTAPSSALDVEGTAAADSAPNLLLKNKALIQSGLIGNAVDIRFAPDLGSSVSNPNAFIRVREDGNSQYGASMSFGTMADGGAGNGPIERMRITSTGSVGIGTNAPSHIFQVAQNAGAAFADSWSTYSSRRWKTNIQTLDGALDKVQKLRGVSYNMKDTGKPEIGVIAEEVGQVVPEIVSYEANGKDAQGVDYSRLTALLIEAVKQQQKLIHQQQHDIAVLRTQVHQSANKSAILESRLAEIERQTGARSKLAVLSSTAELGVITKQHGSR
jgi:Chaperone of endosialidase